MRYRMISNPLVKVEAMQLPAADEDVSQDLANFLAEIPDWESGRHGSLDIRIGGEWQNVPPGDWIKRDSNGFIGTQDHDGFTDEWEPDDE